MADWIRSQLKIPVGRDAAFIEYVYTLDLTERIYRLQVVDGEWLLKQLRPFTDVLARYKELDLDKATKAVKEWLLMSVSDFDRILADVSKKKSSVEYCLRNMP